MNKETFDETFSALLLRYNNARQHRCNRVASARMRDMAKLYSAYFGIPYDDAMAKIQGRVERENNVLNRLFNKKRCS